MEVGVDELVLSIFNRIPKPEKSIQLEFMERLSTKEIYEFLLTFFTEGAKYKFGIDKSDPNTQINIQEWTYKEFDLMKSYFASISFKLELDIVSKNNISSKQFKTYKDIETNTLLKEIKFVIPIGDFIYLMSFDYLV